MSAGINDGGPAYPSSRDMRHSPDFDHEPGMSLRDYFAGEALKGVLYMVAHGAHTVADGPETCAAEAYKLADAMLAAREVKR